MARTVNQVAFRFYPPRPVVVQRHAGQITSDAGLLPVRQFDAASRYTDRMADVLAAEKTELGKLDQLESEIAKELGATKQKD